MDYVLDTSALIFLLEICDLREQLQSFSNKNRLYIPEKVRQEFLDGCRIDEKVLNIFSIVDPLRNNDLSSYFTHNPDSGEYWTIAYACGSSNCLSVIDEGFGRNLCRFLGIKFTGSIGIISEMKKQGFLSKEDLLIIYRRAKNSNFYLSRELSEKLATLCVS